MTDEQRVREVHAEPDAESSVAEPARKWFTCPSCERSCHAYSIDGVWRCSRCFPDAASRLPKAEEDIESILLHHENPPCPTCGSTLRHIRGYVFVPDNKVICWDYWHEEARAFAVPSAKEPAPQTFEEFWVSTIHGTVWNITDERMRMAAKDSARAAWNAAKASSPALSVREEIDRDDAIIQGVDNRGAFFLDWRLASLAAKKGHRGLMTTTAGDFVVLTDMQELELRQAASTVAASSPAVAGESETEINFQRERLKFEKWYAANRMQLYSHLDTRLRCAIEDTARECWMEGIRQNRNLQPLIKDVREKRG